jgi:hypothetical protein
MKNALQTLLSSLVAGQTNLSTNIGSKDKTDETISADAFNALITLEKQEEAGTGPLAKAIAAYTAAMNLK